MKMLMTVTVLAASLGLAACATSPGGVSSSGQPGAVAPSGVTASNGGGQRTTGGLSSVSIGPNGATQTGAPNSKGAAY